MKKRGRKWGAEMLEAHSLSLTFWGTRIRQTIFLTNYTHSSYALYHSGSQKSNLIFLNLSNSELHLFHFLFQEKKANNFFFVVPYSSSFLLLLFPPPTTIHMHFSGLCLRATQFSTLFPSAHTHCVSPFVF